MGREIIAGYLNYSNQLQQSYGLCGGRMPTSDYIIFREILQATCWTTNNHSLLSFTPRVTTTNVSVCSQGFLKESETGTIHGHWMVKVNSFSFCVCVADMCAEVTRDINMSCEFGKRLLT